MFDAIYNVITAIIGWICGIAIITSPFWICWLVDRYL